MLLLLFCLSMFPVMVGLTMDSLEPFPIKNGITKIVIGCCRVNISNNNACGELYTSLRQRALLYTKKMCVIHV